VLKPDLMAVIKIKQQIVEGW